MAALETFALSLISAHHEHTELTSHKHYRRYRATPQTRSPQPKPISTTVSSAAACQPSNGPSQPSSPLASSSSPLPSASPSPSTASCSSSTAAAAAAAAQMTTRTQPGTGTPSLAPTVSSTSASASPTPSTGTATAAASPCCAACWSPPCSGRPPRSV
jgi:hypothetical protein